MSNFESNGNQQKDSKGCLHITRNHQKHDDDDGGDTNKNLILHQDSKGCQDITMDHHHDDTKKTTTMRFKKRVLQQDSKGCEDITKKDDDTKKTMLLTKNPILGYEDITRGIKKVVVLQQEPKGCQDDDTNKLETLQQVAKGCQGDDDHIAQEHQDGVINETIVTQSIENEVVVDDDDGFKTPTSLESRIPVMTICPPTPKPKFRGIKRVRV